MATDHMTPDDFRVRGAEVIDWLAKYMESVGDEHIVPNLVPGEIYHSLPERAPEEPEPFEFLMRDLDELVMPGVVHWQSPGWFAFFPSNNSDPSVLVNWRLQGSLNRG